MDILPKLSHEKLDVYQKSILFLTLSARVLNSMPRGYADLCDQLKRAALSVPLNIAEASGRTRSRDNARHFAIARGSALECGAIFDACQALQIMDKTVYADGKRLLIAVVSMLSKLCNKSQSQSKVAIITITTMLTDKVLRSKDMATHGTGVQGILWLIYF